MKTIVTGTTAQRYYTVISTGAKRYETRFDDEAEAMAYAQRKANSRKREVTVTYTTSEGRTEIVQFVRPEANLKPRAIYSHLKACQAAGMTVEEAAYAWRIGDYR